MSNKRISNLGFLSIESSRAGAIDVENFIDEFDARHDNRRIELH